ncbi:type I-E CRISPR-associated protein Cas5/CasD [Orrella sp. 11846]|uniref:type I-E CRISPR-associated protein Cas5/CasD n=1 Tax=Orrella sp. 11846 TaxID=3409913 RepID=UPI003B5A4992
MWLEAPLQSWGHDSKFGRRDSLDFPTKSGVLGLLCCALGAGGKQIEFLARWAERDMVVQAYVPQDRLGKPVLRQPMLRDFQMVGSGYATDNPWQNLLIPKKSDGGKAVGGGTKMTYRYYLQDMAFAVALQGPKSELEELQFALLNPVWDLYLGRKNCVPTELIGQGVHDSLDNALVHADRLAVDEERSQVNRVAVFKVLQGEFEGDELLILNDVPIQFGSQKRYRDRRVTIVKYDSEK